MHNIANPTSGKEELRRFGIVMGIVIPILFGLLLPWIFHFSLPVWPWIVSVVFILWALLLPRTLKPVYIFWTRFGLFMNSVTTPLILGIVFYLVITPMAVVMKIIGRDAMARKFDKNKQSYFIKSNNRPPRDMEKPF